MFWSLCSGFVREGLQLSLGQRVLYQGLNLLTSQFNLPTAQPRLSALASLLLNVSQPWAGSSGYLVFSSLVVFFFFFLLCATSSPILLEFNTLCIHFTFSKDPEETQIPEVLFPYCSLVSGILLHNFHISQPLPTPVLVLSAQGDHDYLKRLPFFVLQSGNGPKAEIQESSWAHLTRFPSLWSHSPALHAAYCLPAFKYVK